MLYCPICEVENKKTLKFLEALCEVTYNRVKLVKGDSQSCNPWMTHNFPCWV